MTDAKRQLVGYLDASVHRASDPSANVGSTMRRFERSKPYEVITPDTDLATLDGFLRQHDFAVRAAAPLRLTYVDRLGRLETIRARRRDARRPGQVQRALGAEQRAVMEVRRSFKSCSGTSF